MDTDEIRGTTANQLIDFDSADIAESHGAAEPDRMHGSSERPIELGNRVEVLPLIDANPYATGSRKRLFDLIGALFIGVLALPLILVIAITIRLSGTPVLFSHSRIGRGRKPFSCYKFRSMAPNAEEILQEIVHSDPEALSEWRENHKLKNDPRVTRLGDFLRKSSLDELPQLWNVLKGEMSLVGPRPIVPDELERYGNKVRSYCSVRPGMTGLWQISGRSSVTYSRRVSLDMLYIRKQGSRVDLWIILKTIFVVIRRVGAY